MFKFITMKIQYLGFALIALLFFNCDSGSNDSDDDFLNGSNYISENNFYIYSINEEIDFLQIEIDALQLLINSGAGDMTTQEDLDDAIAEQEAYEIELNEAFLNGNPVPLDTPPSECPEVYTCFNSNAKYLVTHNRFYDLEIDIFDDQNNLIFTSSGQTTFDLPGVNDYKYIDIAFGGYTGPVTILVDKYNSRDDLIDYYIPGYAF